jgi:NADH dehydrogenase FAD-containing subunit
MDDDAIIIIGSGAGAIRKINGEQLTVFIVIDRTDDIYLIPFLHKGVTVQRHH